MTNTNKLAQTANATKQIFGIVDFLARLENVKKHSDYFSAKCPNHDDAKNSLIVSEQPNGKITFDCKAKCDGRDVLTKLDLSFADLYPLNLKNSTRRIYAPKKITSSITSESKDERKPIKTETVCRYDYKDETGAILYSKIRVKEFYDDGATDKAFYCSQPNGKKNLNGIRRVLYHLDEINTAPESTTIFLCEGEKDADTLRGFGYIATTNYDGAGSWRDEYNQHFKNHVVVICLDHDRAGVERGETLAEKLHGIAAEIYLLDCFEGEPLADKHGKDVTDFFESDQTIDDFITLLEHAPMFEPVEQTSETAPDATANDETTGGKVIETLIKIGLTAELFNTAKGDTFASFANHKGIFETCAIDSRNFDSWLIYSFWQAEHKSPSENAFKQAKAILSGTAKYERETREVFTRLAHHGANYYLDLSDEQSRIVEITANGWQIIAAKNAPVRFRRSSGMLPLPVPVAGGGIGQLRKFLNVASDDDFLLVLSWLTASLRGDAPKYPILSITGEQGSAKSTTSLILRQLIDPNDAPLRMPARELRELCITANNNFTVVFNNLSHLEQWFSDALCCICEGGGFSVRTLHTDTDETIFKARRPIILNGIAEIATRSDLLDRAICLHLPTITETNRKDEREFFAAFERERPQILGALLTAVCAAMRNLPNVKPSKQEPRMIDFALWARAAEKSLDANDGDFMRAYIGNREAGNGAAIENSTLAQVIIDFIERQERGFWHGTTKELLMKLRERAEILGLINEKSFPKNEINLSKQLKRIAPNLRLAKVSISPESRSNKGTTYSIQQLD